MSPSCLDMSPSWRMNLSECCTVVLSLLWIWFETCLIIFSGTDSCDIESNISSVGIFPWNLWSKASSSQSVLNGSLIFRMLSMQLQTEVHLCACPILFILFNHLLWLVQHWMIVSIFKLRDQTRCITLGPPIIWNDDFHEFHYREKKEFEVRVVVLKVT